MERHGGAAVAARDGVAGGAAMLKGGLAVGGAPPAPKQVRFTVVYRSGEDPEFPAAELNTHSPQTRGWQSPPFCAYPQELGLEFSGGEVVLSQLQILSHESKIATKIDVFVGRGDSWDSAQFKRLGHLSLDDNERSGFAARELKSVYLGKRGRFLKLRIHKCHLNRQNIYNQAGVIAVNVLGFEGAAALQQPQDDEPQPQHSARFEPQAPAPHHSKPVPVLEDLAFDLNFDAATAQAMRDLHAAKERAVAAEEFELAKEIKRAEDQLKVLGANLARLEAAKRQAVAREDYDEAANVKKDVLVLRGKVDHLVLPLLEHHQQPRGARRSDSGQPQPQRRLDLAQQAPLQQPQQSAQQQQQQQQQQPPQGLAQPGVQLPAVRVPASARWDERELENELVGSSSSHGAAEAAGSAPPRKAQARAVAMAPPTQQQLLLPQHSSEDERPLPALQGGAQRSPSAGNNNNASSGGGLTARSEGRGAFEQGGESYSSQNQQQAAEDDLDLPSGPATEPAVIAQALGLVPGYEELPEAEPLPAGLQGETAPLVDVLGPYLVRCLYSRQVKLRSAALSALEAGIANYQWSDPRVFAALAQVVRMTAADKISNVYLQGLRVLELAVERAQASLRRSDLALLDAFMPQIVERLGNNTGRVRQASAQLLVHLASQKSIGPLFVSSFALRAKRAGKTLLWRQLLGRLALVAVLIKEFGTRDEYGLGLDQVMEFVASNNALAHPNAEVREACKDLFMQAYVHNGKAVLPYLKDLRPKQMEEYQTGFQAIDEGNGAPQAGAAAAASTASLGGDEPKEAKPSKTKGSAAKGDKPAGAAATATASAAAAEKAAAAAEKAAAGGGADSTRDSARDSQPRPSSRSAVAVAAQPSPPSPVVVNVNVVQQQQGYALGAEEEEETEGEVEAFTCQFCSRKDPTLTEDALDMHYWKECPMLTSCAQCEQVIEVALLNEHLLKECENKDNHRQCLRCNEAIAAQFFEQHSQRASCLPAKPVSKANRCPLCHKDCKAGVQGWKQHILAGQGCPKNPRTAHLR